MRTEAQKRADKRYKDKNKGSEVTWATTLKPSDAEAVNQAIAGAGISKAEFVRQAARQLKKEGN